MHSINHDIAFWWKDLILKLQYDHALITAFIDKRLLYHSYIVESKYYSTYALHMNNDDAVQFTMYLLLQLLSKTNIVVKQL